MRWADVELPVARPERCRAEVAVLGRHDGRFRPVPPLSAVTHREGRAVRLRVPLGAGWAVLRVR